MVEQAGTRHIEALEMTTGRRIQCSDRRDQAFGPLQHGFKLPTPTGYMLCEKAIELASDGPPRWSVAGCSFDCQAAFRVKSERPVVQVRRANQEQPVIDDHHLRMDGDRHVARREGGKRPEAAVAIRRPQPVDQMSIMILA
jgi:hypothetical protein